MRWKRGNYWTSLLDRRDQKFAQWHFWFAWFPVTITGTDTKVWAETVDRRRIWVDSLAGGFEKWEYKL